MHKKEIEEIVDFSIPNKSHKDKRWELRSRLCGLVEEAKQLAVLDYVPKYRTKEQFEMFIESRKKDMEVLKDTIKEAEKQKKNLVEETFNSVTGVE